MSSEAASTLRDRGACSAGSSSAFTLVELLVVIGIVGLLAALALPALGKARQTAREMVCLSNERQLAIAWTAYATDYKAWPLTDDTKPWNRVHYGWGGVHWFGENDSPAGMITIPKARPLNPYFASDSRIENREAVFKCPSDSGAFLAATGTRSWDPIGQQSNCPDIDKTTCYGVAGTSYEANEWMYCKVGSVNGMGFAPSGAPPPNFRFNQGPQNVVVSPSRFVILGDIGAMSAGRVNQPTRIQHDLWTAWWHGYEKGQLAFLDGSARREKMGKITMPRYTFYLDPTRQPIGSRTFAFTW